VATSGNVDVLGTLSKGGGSFKIDHPLDPANKYLYHSFVESPDMMNIYNGNVTTDANGDAAVELPEWFEILNRDFRYQLTVIGQFAQAIVAGKVANHQFVIKTDKPNVEVSWQVTGIRQDAFANTHRIQVEAEKAPADRGHYLYPELVGAPETARIGYMAPAPKGKPIVHTRLPFPKPGNASPLQRRPASILAPPMPVAPAGKLAVNPK
jgi:trimeric autotransporter adhesin